MYTDSLTAGERAVLNDLTQQQESEVPFHTKDNFSVYAYFLAINTAAIQILSPIALPFERAKIRTQASNWRGYYISKVFKDVRKEGPVFKGAIPSLAGAYVSASARFIALVLGLHALSDSDMVATKVGVATVATVIDTPISALIANYSQLRLEYPTQSRYQIQSQLREAPFRGITPTVAKRLVGTATAIITYQILASGMYAIFKAAKLKDDLPSNYANSAIGFAAGSAAAVASNPFDVIKTNMQVHKRGLMDSVQHIYKNAGGYGFFRGMMGRSIGYGLAGAIVLGATEYYTFLNTGSRSIL